MNKKIFIIAGEESGDILGKNLIREIKKIEGENISFFGIGGKKMQKEGGQGIKLYRNIAVIGFWEVIKVLYNAYSMMKFSIKYVKKIKPDAVITIDSPGFNFRFVKKVRPLLGNDTKFIHYVAPTVWAYDPERANDVAKIYDHILLLFPFEKQYFPNIASTFVGHPAADRYVFSVRQNNTNRATVSLFPGSRNSELNHHMSILIDTIRMIQLRMKHLKISFVFHTLPHLKNDIIKLTEKADTELDIRIVDEENAKKEELKNTDLALTKSGTSCLEIAKQNIPIVMFYRLSNITYSIIKRKVCIKWACIINILANREIVKEFIQDKMTQKNIVEASCAILSDMKNPAEHVQAYEEVINSLKPTQGPKLSGSVAAKCVLSILNLESNNKSEK